MGETLRTGNKNKRKYLVGIDAGTSVVKSVIFDLDGKQISSAKKELNYSSPKPSWAELDMDQLWKAVVETLKEIMTDNKNIINKIAGIGITGTASGAWLVDSQFKPIRPAILWNDGRSGDILKEWQEEGVTDQIFDISGNIVFPGFGVAVLRWLKDNEPKTLEKARNYFYAKDWIRFQLTGDWATDDTDASFFPFDLVEKKYSSRIMRLCGIGNIDIELPPIKPSHQVRASVTGKAAQETGLPEGIPVVTGLNDAAAAALGAGVVSKGQACSVLGTSNLNHVVVDSPLFLPRSVGCSQSTVDNKWLRSLVNTCGTLNIDWAIKVLYSSEKTRLARQRISIYELMEKEAASVPIGSSTLIYHPYLNSTGVVSPFVHPGARGTFFGLAAKHTRAHLTRAIYEGASLAIYDCYKHIPISVPKIVLSGGGARSKFWCQIISDVTGKEVVVPAGEEFGARGAAIVAAIGLGLFSNAKEAVSNMVYAKDFYQPNIENHDKYKDIYSLYSNLALDLNDHWWQRHKLENKY
ncbi:MAG TPA: FGGY-family carbohydrate kinase [Halanaerobiales bacterium]|nr:FGGY-family carbohydrate kinase [Halanaerobiales bacterium]